MPTKHRGTRREVLALDAYIKLQRASESLSARLSRTLAANDLTTSQFGSLEALYHLGPMCQRALAEKLLKSTGNMTTVVDHLEQRGLVARVRDTNDRRFITLNLTDKGRALITAVFPKHAEEVAAAFDALTEDEREQLGVLCKKLGIAVADMPARRDGTTG